MPTLTAVTTLDVGVLYTACGMAIERRYEPRRDHGSFAKHSARHEANGHPFDGIPR